MLTNVMQLTLKSCKKLNFYNYLFMGLNKNQSTNALYLFQGKIITAATKESHTLEKNGKFYNQYDSVEGRITDVKIVDGYEGNKDVAMTITDIEGSYTMYFGVNSNYFRSFARSVKNVDFTKNIEFFPTYKKEGEKINTSLLMKQDGNWIKRFYTRENMGEMPVAMPVEVNGKTTYDYKDQNDFLIAELIGKFEEEKLPF